MKRELRELRGRGEEELHLCGMEKGFGLSLRGGLLSSAVVCWHSGSLLALCAGDYCAGPLASLSFLVVALLLSQPKPQTRQRRRKNYFSAGYRRWLAQCLPPLADARSAVENASAELPQKTSVSPETSRQI